MTLKTVHTLVVGKNLTSAETIASVSLRRRCSSDFATEDGRLQQDGGD